MWIERDPTSSAPLLDSGLDGWEIQKRRRSHWNARRVESGDTYYLKWFFHGSLTNPARLEWRAAQAVASLGIPTVEAIGWGRHARGSFVVLRGSPGFPLADWRQHGLSSAKLHRLARELARLAARLHGARLCHKDFNVYHVLVAVDGLRVIDVGRVAPFVRRRWIVKDLASLLASALREGIECNVARVFLQEYLRQDGHGWRRRQLLSAVLGKARRYRQRNDSVARVRR